MAPESVTPQAVTSLEAVTSREAVTPRENSVSVWYIRHGENPANLTGELSCRTVDYPLTSHGVEQARALADLLSREPAPAAIYASPLRRAAQTAQILATRLGIPVRTLEELRELDVGDLEGRSDEQAWELFLDVYYAWHAGDYDRAFPGGEDFHHVLARLTAALTRALDHPPGSRVLVVAHDGLIRAALPALCPGTAPPLTSLPKCGIARVSARTTPGGPEFALLAWPEPDSGDGMPAEA
ncbi:MAG: fructose-2,6-bisphosphatase [Actinomycetia bacterium]|nr:fructose-2,6-bisphosphatase [Actinomycetes bacterium]